MNIYEAYLKAKEGKKVYYINRNGDMVTLKHDGIDMELLGANWQVEEKTYTGIEALVLMKDEGKKFRIKDVDTDNNYPGVYYYEDKTKYIWFTPDRCPESFILHRFPISETFVEVE